MKHITKLLVIMGAVLVVGLFLIVARFMRVQAQTTSIVGTWYIGTDVVATFHSDGTLITVTEFSLTHPDTPQLGIWWQDGDVIYWKELGYTLSNGSTTTVSVTGTIQMTSADEIINDPLVEIALPNGTTVTDDPPPTTGIRMLPPSGS